MRILGLDYGSKTVGVAVSDELLFTAQGLEIVRRQSPNKLRQSLARIEEIIKKLGLTIVKYRSSPLLNISEDKGSKMEDLTENFSSLSGGSM